MNPSAEVQFGWLSPLRRFYASAGIPFPPVTVGDAGGLPEPDRELLVHDVDMTSVLERHHGTRIELRVLASEQSDGILARQVVLVSESAGQPFEFGAIEIHLDVFDPESRRRVVEGRRPLGAILRESGMVYASRPTAFIQMTSDDVVNRALNLSAPYRLFGRCNLLHTNSKTPIAEVVEILPPAVGREPMEPGR